MRVLARMKLKDLKNLKIEMVDALFVLSEASLPIAEKGES